MLKKQRYIQCVYTVRAYVDKISKLLSWTNHHKSPPRMQQRTTKKQNQFILSVIQKRQESNRKVHWLFIWCTIIDVDPFGESSATKNGRKKWKRVRNLMKNHMFNREKKTRIEREKKRGKIKQISEWSIKWLRVREWVTARGLAFWVVRFEFIWPFKSTVIIRIRIETHKEENWQRNNKKYAKSVASLVNSFFSFFCFSSRLFFYSAVVPSFSLQNLLLRCVCHGFLKRFRAAQYHIISLLGKHLGTHWGNIFGLPLLFCHEHSLSIVLPIIICVVFA